MCLERFLGEEQKIQPASGIVHFMLDSFNLGVEVAVGKETSDGDEQTKGGGD